MKTDFRCDGNWVLVGPRLGRRLTRPPVLAGRLVYVGGVKRSGETFTNVNGLVETTIRESFIGKRRKERVDKFISTHLYENTYLLCKCTKF